MTRRENLVPVRTVDKNGRSTTVYRRTDQGALAKKPFPAPAAEAPSEERVELNRKVAEKLLDSTRIEAKTRRQVVNTIGALSTETVEAISKTLDEHEGKSLRFMIDTIRTCLVTKDIPGSGIDGEVQEFIYFAPMLPEVPFSLAEKIIGSLHNYQELPETDYFHEADEETLVKCRSLAQVIHATIYHSFDDDRFTGHGFVFADDRITDFVLTNPERTGELVDAIKERGTAKWEVMSMVIDGEAKALGSGAL